MNRATKLSEKLDSIHDGMAKTWVWGLTVIVVALFMIVFNELWAMGQISTEAADGLVVPLSVIAIVGFVGFGLWVASLGFGIVGWYIEERGST